VQYWTTFTPPCTCPLNHVKTLKLSWLMDELRSLKVSPNIYLVIHGFNTFGPIISNLVHELTLNPLLLFHHVMHIQKYPRIKVQTPMIQTIPCGYCVFCCRFVDGWALTSATFKLRHTSINWVLPWGIEILVLFENKRASRLANWLVIVEICNSGCKTLHAHGKMKKCGSIKNKVVKHIVKVNIKKATLILHTHLTHGIDDLNETGHAWMVQIQQHLNMTYEVPFPFTKYACCTCEWTLRGNLCNHQVVILLTCISLTKENIIQYCGIWYGSNHGGFVAMFMDPTYLHIYDNEFNDEEAMISF
jgi:hypothetical protein